MKWLNKGEGMARPLWGGIQATCHACGAIVELEDDDDVYVIMEHSLGEPERTNAYMNVNCPNCMNTIVIHKEVTL